MINRYSDYSDLYDDGYDDFREGKALAHTNDPETSKIAADKLVKSGALNRQEQRVLGYALTYLGNDFTAKELSEWSDFDYFTIQRRLSGLHNKGKIERTGGKRGGCMIWRIK